MTFLRLFIFFIIYSFIGWVCEVIYCSLPAKKFINRGFLYGPLCPIYGIGALFVQLTLASFEAKFAFIPVVFLLGMIGASIIEYFTSFWMEKVFHLRWWDYSSYKFNLNGRICLLNSLEFGLMSVAMVYLVNPFVMDLITNLTKTQINILDYSLISIFTVDLGITLAGMFHLKKVLIKAINIVGEIATDMKENINNAKIEINEKYDGKFSQYVYAHFMKRYPGATSRKYQHNLKILKERFDLKLKKLQEERKNKKQNKRGVKNDNNK